MPGPMEVASARGGLSSKRGVKRQPDESNLNDEQRFTKRFNLLNLDSYPHGTSHTYVPVQAEYSTSDPNGQPHVSSPTSTHAHSGKDASMQVDDTKHRVYIGDLDAEVAEIEAHEPHERLIFLPDIEKHMSRIPQHLLRDRGSESADSQHDDQQLVVYGVPKSLTVDESHDSVRKAIIEARHRAQERAAEEARHEDMKRMYGASGDEQHSVEIAHGYSTGYAVEPAYDSDAMDIE